MIEILITVSLDTGLGAIGLVQDVAHHYLALGLQRNSIEIEGACGSFVAEADNNDPLAVLGGEVSAVDDAVVNLVAEVFGQRTADHVESAPLVMRHEVLDVLQQEGAWTFGVDDAANIKEQGALRFVVEAMRAPQRIFLAHSCNREGLTGKACKQHVVIRHVPGFDLGDATGDQVAIVEVLGIGLLRVTVPLAGEHAMATNALESGTDATNASEQIDESVCGIFGVGCTKRQNELTQCVGGVRFGLALYKNKGYLFSSSGIRIAGWKPRC